MSMSPHRFVLFVTILVALTSAPPAHGAGFRLGFGDGVFLDAANAGPWLARAMDENASLVRIASSWSSVATTRPAAPRDPGDPAYHWETVDDAVRAARDHHLSVLLSLTGAPGWAVGSDAPKGVTGGTWRPDAAAYGDFARAVATRYRGLVSAYQPWNEPNLERYLTPQWAMRDGKLEPESPRIYRRLLNAFYAGIKAVQPSATVVSAGTAPFGDPEPGGPRIMPVTFDRSLLCLDASCDDPPHFDALSHHPYSVRGPNANALNAGDVSVNDMHKLTVLLGRAEKKGTALPRGPKQFWVTEVSWDSSPPDPDGVPAARQARWLAGTFFRLWKQGVRTITWFQIRDQAPLPSYGATNQSGTYQRDGTAKPSAAAFAFPFVAEPTGSGRLELWGKAPHNAPVVVERGSGATWKAVTRRSTSADGVFDATMTVRSSFTYRARQGSVVSPVWKPGLP